MSLWGVTFKNGNVDVFGVAFVGVNTACYWSPYDFTTILPASRLYNSFTTPQGRGKAAFVRYGG